MKISFPVENEKGSISYVGQELKQQHFGKHCQIYKSASMYASIGGSSSHLTDTQYGDLTTLKNVAVSPEQKVHTAVAS